MKPLLFSERIVESAYTGIEAEFYTNDILTTGTRYEFTPNGIGQWIYRDFTNNLGSTTSLTGVERLIVQKSGAPVRVTLQSIWDNSPFYTVTEINDLLDDKADVTDLDGYVQSVTGTGDITVNNTDPQNPIINYTGNAGIGDVVGPASSTTNNIVLFDGTDGKLIKDSGLLIGDLITETDLNTALDEYVLDTELVTALEDYVLGVSGIGDITVDNTDPQNPVISYNIPVGGKITIESIATAQTTIIPQQVKWLETQFYDPNYTIPSTLVGGADYYRVDAEPSHAGKLRTQDRFLTNGVVDLSNGGWWEIESKEITVSSFGASPARTSTQNTAAIQAAIDYFESKGGGVVIIPPGLFMLGASTLSETYDNAGVGVAASTTCLVLRPRVRLQGAGIGASCLKADSNGTLNVIYPISPNGSGVLDLEIDGSWNFVNGAGHGIIQLNETSSNTTCKKALFENLHIHHCASYGIGIENGDLEDVVISNCYIHDVGADGIDSKQRGPAQENRGLFIDNILVERFGLRADGQAGVDCHGRANVSNIQVRDFGRVGAETVGVRLRTKSPPGIEGDNAKGSSLVGFIIEPGSDGVNYGVQSGSDDVHISQGIVKGGKEGISLTGNVNGTALYNTVSGVTCEGQSDYGFRAAAGCNNAQFTGCTAKTAGIAGFRNEAENTQFTGSDGSNCTVPLSTSSGASPSERITGGLLGTNGLTQGSGSSRSVLFPSGAGTDISLVLQGKGGSPVAIVGTPVGPPPLAKAISLYWTSDTQVTLKMRGTDNVVRSIVFTVA